MFCLNANMDTLPLFVGVNKHKSEASCANRKVKMWFGSRTELKSSWNLVCVFNCC